MSNITIQNINYLLSISNRKRSIGVVNTSYIDITSIPYIIANGIPNQAIGRAKNISIGIIDNVNANPGEPSFDVSFDDSFDITF